MNLDRTKSSKIVKQALSFEKPDRLPVFDGCWGDYWFDSGKWRIPNKVSKDVEFEEYYWTDLLVPVANEALFPSQMGEVKRDGDDIYINDGWGRVVRTKVGAEFSEPVSSIFNEPSDLDKIEFESASLDSRYDTLIEEVRDLREKGKAAFVKIGGVYIRSAAFRGEVKFLMDMVQDESFARAIAQKMADHLLQIGLESLKRTNTGEFGVWVYDDMCNINGPMFSPATFEKIFLPIYKELISSLKSAGARWVILHCDGNLRPFLDLIVEAGFDGINPVEPAAGMDAVKLIEQYHGRLSFIGGICNTQILPSGNPAEIRKHVEALIEAGRNGGLVIGTHSIGEDISLESYELYRQIVVEQGAYTQK